MHTCRLYRLANVICSRLLGRVHCFPSKLDAPYINAENDKRPNAEWTSFPATVTLFLREPAARGSDRRTLDVCAG